MTEDTITLRHPAQDLLDRLKREAEASVPVAPVPEPSIAAPRDFGLDEQTIGPRVGAGFVYFITDGAAIKIGYSVDPKTRMQDMQVAHHADLRFLGILASTANLNEKSIHGAFSHLHIRGEWFKRSPALAAFILDRRDTVLGIKTTLREVKNEIATLRRRPKEYSRSGIDADLDKILGRLHALVDDPGGDELRQIVAGE